MVNMSLRKGSLALPGPSNEANAIEIGSNVESRASASGGTLPSSRTPRTRSRTKEVKGISISSPGAEPNASGDTRRPSSSAMRELPKGAFGIAAH